MDYNKWKRIGAALALSVALSLPVSAEIVKGPYLQNVTTNGITIMWESDVPTIGIVLYGETPDYGRQAAEEKAVRIHEIHLGGLEIETTYHYKVLSSADASVDLTFQTAVRAGSPFTFVYYGDNKNGPHMHRRNALAISAEKPNIVLQCGDLVNRGFNYSEWGRLFFGPAAPLIAHVPLYPTLGNHERNAEYYYDYLSLPSKEDSYSFDYGNAHFVVLDTNKLRKDSPQMRWLIQDLGASGATWKFVSFHHPPFTSGGNYYTSTRVRLKNLLHPVFENHGVDMVFNGHDHHYERSLPIVSSQGKRPVTYVVNGNGGTPLRYVGKREFSAYSQRVFGYTLVRMNGERLELEGKTVDGKVIDRLVIDKGDPAADKTYVESALAFESIKDPVEAIEIADKWEDLAEDAIDNEDNELAAKALAQFERAFELDPTFAEALVEMGKLNRMLGDEELAIQQFEEAIDLLPGYPDSYEELVDVYMERKKWATAMEFANQLHQVAPDQTDGQEAMAGICLKQGKRELAVLHLMRALEIVPSESGVHEDLAKLYATMGRNAEARQHYTQAIKWMNAEETEEIQELVAKIEALR